MKTKLILLIAAFFIVAYAGAEPASQKPFDITQPDGTVITLHMVGDEYYHWTETTDNQVVIRSEEGYYEYATIQNGEIVPSGVKASNTIVDAQLNMRAALPNREQLVDLMWSKRTAIIKEIDSLAQVEELSVPASNTRASSNISLTKGNQKVLCILMEFPDRSFTKTKADFQNMWNQTGYNVEGSMGSVKDFYYENSYGQMNVTATVVGPYMAEHNSSYYATNGPEHIYQSNVRTLVREAIKAAKNDIQFANFDINGDNLVDAIHIVHAGYAQSVNPNIGLIWPHHGALITAVWQNNYRAKEYFITSELAKDSGTKIAPIGSVCHEYGHQLGAPDYYCPDYTYPGTGKWDVMGTGSRNGFNTDGRCPAHHNPYTKAYIFDWVTPTVINSSVSNATYTLTPIHNTTSIYRINTSTNNEFFLLENKQSVINTFNYWIPDRSGGLLIYHIHSDIENAIDHQNVNDSHPQKCYIVCANATSNPTSSPSSYGSIIGSDCAYPYSNKMFFTSYSTPSSQSWAGVPTGVNLHYIQRSGVNITFIVNLQINGDGTLTSPATYSTALPAGATIKWTYTFTPSGACEHVPGEPIVFVNGDTTASVTIRRSLYQILEPTNPRIGEGVELTPLPTLKPFSGTLVLKATITLNGSTYIMTKTITLPESDNVLPPIDQIDGTTDTTIEVTATADDVENNSIATYRLRHANPISADNSVVHVEKLSDAGDDYIPYNGNYTLEVWHDQLGLVERIEDNTPYLYLNCGDMPTGVYQMILIVNEQIVAQSKLLKL